MEWMLMPYKKLYAVIAGRSSRQEFWMFWLLNVIVVALFVTLFMAFFGAAIFNIANFSAGLSAVSIISIALLAVPFYIWAMITMPALVAVTIRRFHDLNLSGWLYLIFAIVGIIPVINILSGIVLIVMMCIKGTNGPNKYGSDPTMPETSVDVFS